MDAPEFARTEKLRRVFGVLQDRDYLGDLVPSVTARATCGCSSAARTGTSRCTTCRSSWRPTAGGARASGVVGVLGPTRMAYPHAISTVRYVSGLMNELVDHLYA